MEREAYSTSEAAARLGVDIKTVYAGIREGKIPSLRIGRKILIPRAAFNRMLEMPPGPRAA